MIKEKIIEFNKITLDGIKMLEENLDIEEIIQKREEIINFLKNENLEKKEIKELIKEINLFENDKKLIIELEKERERTKEEMEMLKKRKQMRNSYGNINKKVYFNKTI